MFKNFILLAGFLSFATSDVFAVSQITKIEYSGKKSPQTLVITGDGPLTIEKSENVDDHQIVLEIKDAKFANKNVARRLDASSFPGNVSLISPYAVEGTNSVRIIVQLRKGGSTNSELQSSGKISTLTLSNERSNAASNTAPSESLVSSNGDAVVATQSDTTENGDAAPAEKGEMKLDEIEASLKNKNYVGRRITVNFKDADIVDVFKLIGETSGFNLIVGGDVVGKLTLSLTDVPWDQVLDLVLTTMKLGAERNGNILRIATLTALTLEKDQLLRAKNAANSSAPRVTRIFPISYAKPSDLVGLLTKFGAGSAGATEGSAAARDTIVVDERTNSLVIQDIQDNLDRMAKLIELMDKPTPQVQIEARIVEGSESFGKSMSGNLGFGAKGNSNKSFGYGLSPGGKYDSTLASTPIDTATPTTTRGALGMGLNIAQIYNFRLNASLNLFEEESRSKTISAPRLVVLNKQKANIVQGQPVLVPTASTNPVNGAIQTANTVQSAILSLDVTPTVTNDGNILMDVNVNSNVPKSVGSDQSGIANRSVKTLVVTESGGTLVIGGVYTQSEGHGEGGFPFLRKLPLIGALFGNSSDNNDKSELFIFISPRVLNEAESGGAG
jgi:type IV pilus assembly protein PilQ